MAQSVGTEYPFSSVKQLRFMLWPSSCGQSALQAGLSPRDAANEAGAPQARTAVYDHRSRESGKIDEVCQRVLTG